VRRREEKEVAGSRGARESDGRRRTRGVLGVEAEEHVAGLVILNDLENDVIPVLPPVVLSVKLCRRVELFCRVGREDRKKGESVSGREMREAGRVEEVSGKR
jgi:hypothetical protein